MYYVNITGRANVKNFALKIQSSHKRKRELLNTIIAS